MYMKRNTVPIVLASILLGLLFDFFFYGKILGISYFLFCASIVGTTFYLASYYRQTISKSVLLLSTPILFFSAMVLVRASEFLTFLNVVFVLYLLLLGGQLLMRPNRELSDYTLKDYITRSMQLPLLAVGAFFSVLQQWISDPKASRLKTHDVRPVIRGLILSLPFLFIFLLLLSSADLVFKRYIGSLFDFHLAPEAISRSILILFVASLFLGAYALLFTRNKQDQEPKTREKKLSLGTVEASMVLGSVAFLFLIFVVIQITYLFGGQSNITATGFTYAEYARKGFFELIAVAIISLALILAIKSSTIQRTLQQKVVFMWLSGVVIIEVLIIMLSAHRRLGLYEQAYGFTALRLYSHLFIGLLAVVFTLLLVHILRERRENQFAFQVFLVLIAFLGITNLLNPDAFIARQNIQRFNRDGKVDLRYLTDLSEDAVPEISKLLESSNATLQNGVARDLYAQKQRLDNHDRSWQSFNISRSRAKDILREHEQQLEANKAYPYSPTDQLNSN